MNTPPTVFTEVVKTRNRKKKVAAAAFALMGISGIGIAFWTTGGSGTGSASTGDVEALVINQASVITGLAPGAAPVALSGTFDNPNDAAVGVTSITGEVTGTSATGCLVAWYDVAGTGTVAGGSVPTGNGVGSWSGLTIQLVNDPAVNQDVCKNATLTITYTAS